MKHDGRVMPRGLGTTVGVLVGVVLFLGFRPSLDSPIYHHWQPRKSHEIALQTPRAFIRASIIESLRNAEKKCWFEFTVNQFGDYAKQYLFIYFIYWQALSTLKHLQLINLINYIFEVENVNKSRYKYLYMVHTIYYKTLNLNVCTLIIQESLIRFWFWIYVI